MIKHSPPPPRNTVLQDSWQIVLDDIDSSHHAYIESTHDFPLALIYWLPVSERNLARSQASCNSTAVARQVLYKDQQHPAKFEPQGCGVVQ
jgi:hypothetical protein